jgi:glycosyltransferase involved in cell wall biosynthesis
MPGRLLYFCPLSLGGIADYGHEQAKALAATGWDVTMLCPSDYPHSADGYRQLRLLAPLHPRTSRRLVSRIRLTRRILDDAKLLDRLITGQNFEKVLFANYSEYLAPLWAWRFRRHARRGVTFAAVVHDPVRDYIVGPRWWHRRSIAAAFSFLRTAFLHSDIQLDTGTPMPDLRTPVIPHGPFPFPPPSISRDTLRESLGIPESATLFLSFGHLRDGKNLDLVLQALREIPEAWLLVSGTEANSGQRPSQSYQELAEQLGVAARCRWMIGYQSKEAASNVFHASDVVILTYSAAFRSASGVLNVAAWFRKPVLASAGASALLSLVQKYNLGVAIAPDDASLIAGAMMVFCRELTNPDWPAYLADNAWMANAFLVSTYLNR